MCVCDHDGHHIHPHTHAHTYTHTHNHNSARIIFVSLPPSTYIPLFVSIIHTYTRTHAQHSITPSSQLHPPTITCKRYYIHSLVRLYIIMYTVYVLLYANTNKFIAPVRPHVYIHHTYTNKNTYIRVVVYTHLHANHNTQSRHVY